MPEEQMDFPDRVEFTLGMCFKDDPYGPLPSPMLDVAAAIEGMLDYTYEYFGGRGKCRIWKATGISGDPALSRMKLVDGLMGSHLLMLDADSRPEKDVLVKLYQADKDIVGCPMVTKRYPSWINVFRKTKGCDYEHFEPQVDFTYEDWVKGNVLECDAVGFGCILVKREVFDEIPPPYFVREGHQRWSAGTYGHDVSFCIKAARAGLKIFAHFGAKVRHAVLEWHSVDAHLNAYAGDPELRQIFADMRLHKEVYLE